MLTATSDDWRLGVRIVSGALLAIAALRATLPEPDAGMLAVRRRSVDVGVAIALAAGLLILAASIPDQPTL